GAEGHPQGVYQVTVQTADAEEVTYQYTVPVPAMAGQAERVVTAYVVPGGEGVEFTVHLETTAGKRIETRPKLTRDASRDEVLASGDVLVLAVGAGLSQLKRAAEKLDQPKGKEDAERDMGRRQFTFAEDVSALPDRWFGLDAVDVVVLATGKADF